MDIGQMWVRIEDREIITQVMFNDEGTEPLLRAMALEGTFLGVDPVRHELVPFAGGHRTLARRAAPIACYTYGNTALRNS